MMLTSSCGTSAVFTILFQLVSLLIATKDKVKRLLQMSLVLEVFGHKPKNLTILTWQFWNFDLMVELEEKSEDHQSAT